VDGVAQQPRAAKRTSPPINTDTSGSTHRAPRTSTPTPAAIAPTGPAASASRYSEPLPASVLVVVTAHAHPDMLIEIACEAVVA